MGFGSGTKYKTKASNKFDFVQVWLYILLYVKA